MVRRHAVVLTLALAAPLLAACSGDPEITSDRSDLERAVAVWSDPWVAPDSATVAGPALGSNGQVDRVVARRTTSYDRDVASAARSELHAAKSHGWLRTSSTCGDAVQVALVSPSGDALAQLVVTPEGDGAEAALQVVTRHHLDATWPAPDTIELTCLNSQSPTFVAPPIQSTPLGDASAVDDAPAEWQDEAGASALLDEVNADPALESVGVRVAAPRLEDGVNRRLAPAGVGSTAARSLGGLAAELDGWTLTSAACGGGGSTRGTFVRSYGDGWAVLAATITDDTADLRVTLPVDEGPDPAWLGDLVPVEGSVCVDGPTSRLPRQSDGVPAVLPSDLTPIAD
ncbi:hypothetical protein EUA93_05875 [Nocardioides oleivorans]|uniref:Uncharacterized protein n=1 Tax=Nocardioides oleivorans TaxID=273676 RepID=A0A4Q2RYM3_9ACTN|nr:hypothetical protein [Nocardioides oleivorans]RYB93926.1 hypothetical protein EUA93_05875 [Nocardioides oleivorans]